MKRKISLVAGAMLFSGAVLAQTTWEGPFVGLYSGVITTEVGVQNSFDWAFEGDDGFFAYTGSKKTTTPLGITAGYNWQFPNSLVVGFDVNYSNGTSNSFSKAHRSNQGDIYAEKLDKLMTLKAKLGYAFNNTYVYVTAGPSRAKMQLSVNSYGYLDPSGANYNATLSGNTIGVGIERKFNKKWSLSAEYLQTSLKSKTACMADNGQCWSELYDMDESVKWDPSIRQIKVGVNYSF